MDERKALQSLQEFIKALVKSRIKTREQYRRWRKRNEAAMEKFFWYKKDNPLPSGDVSKGQKMPPVTSLVGVFFHPEEPLIGLNYTPVAHNTLHSFPEGWTPPLRLCRGIIFSRRGKLVAKPFNKFFNYGENKETKELPDEPFDATVKHDGHLGIVFGFRNKLFLTTRGDFQSRTAKIGGEMLARQALEKNWNAKFPKDLTVLAEVIHPSTKVHLDYHRQEKFILIGACDCETLKDSDHAELQKLGELLGLEVTERWSGESLKDLKALMEDLTVRNREGYVVRFKSGLRVKFKFATYINKMVEAKLGYGYLMKRIIGGNLEKMIKFLPEEIYAETRKMTENICRVKDLDVPEKEKRQYLYGLVAKKESTQNYRATCRGFLQYLAKNQKNQRNEKV